MEKTNTVIVILQGDITSLPESYDAIVNSAGSTLMGGGGVDGAVHKKAGWEALNEECTRALRDSGFGSTLPTGKAVITPALGITGTRYIIHTVGPICGLTPRPELQLKKSIRSCLDLAEKNSLSSIAFPLISTGAFGFSVEFFAANAKEAFSKYRFRTVSRVALVAFNSDSEAMLKKLF